jgi:rhodanese-related sulfurtransferase
LPESPSSNVSSPSESSNSQAAEGTMSLSPESMISAGQLDDGIKAEKDWAIIDVREIIEFATGHVPTAKNIPLGTLEQNLNQFPKDKEIILVCLTGQRAFTAWQTLISKGYDSKKVKVLIGGMEQWKSLGSGEVTESIGGC